MRVAVKKPRKPVFSVSIALLMIFYYVTCDLELWPCEFDHRTFDLEQFVQNIPFPRSIHPLDICPRTFPCPENSPGHLCRWGTVCLPRHFSISSLRPCHPSITAHGLLVVFEFTFNVWILCCISNTVLVDHVAVETRLQGRVAAQNRYEYEHRHCRQKLLLVREQFMS